MKPGGIDVEPVGLTRCGAVVWRTRGALRVTAVVKATFALAHDAAMTACPPAPLARKDLYLDKSPSNSLVASSDLAPHLPRADVTFVGHAYAPGGRAVPASSVRIAVFRDRPLLDKTLHVFGDRRAGGGPPAPFQRMPIVYERAARGGGENPVGVAAEALPNIVDPRAPDSPAGFGPISRYWLPRRRLLAGTDRGAIEAAIAEIPDGFTWDYFQAAPPDQQIEHLRGEEWLVLDGLHPALPRLQTRLPGARAGVMVHTRDAQGYYGPGYPIALVADTLAIDGDRMTASIVWRASFPVRDAETLAMLRIFGGIALPGAPIAWPAPSSVDVPEEIDLEPDPEPSIPRGELGRTVPPEPEPRSRPSLPFQAGAVPPSRPSRPDLPTVLPGTPWSGAAAPPAPAVAADAEVETRMIDVAALRRPGEPAAPEFGTALAPAMIDLAPALPFAAPPRVSADDEGGTQLVDLAALQGADTSAPALPFQGGPASSPTPRVVDEEDGGTRVVDVAALRGAGADQRASALPFAALPGSGAAIPRPTGQSTAGLPFQVPASAEGESASRWFHTAERAPGAPFDDGAPPAIEPPRRRGAAIPIVNRTPLKAATLPWQMRPPQDSLTVLVKGTFDLAPDAPAKIREEADDPTGDLHVDDDENKSLAYASDFAVFKPKADVTLTGHAHAPRGSSPAAQAAFHFGAAKQGSEGARGVGPLAAPPGKGFRRAIAVLGDRRWQKAVVALAPTQPEPFASMPLTYERAFGGPRYDRNPAGVGHKGAPGEDGIARLPNLEDPGHMIRGPGDTPAPACFAPVPVLWKERYGRMGTYDRRWLELRWPYFPEDFDWAYFQAAPASQQLDHLTGDEPYELRGLHAQHPLLAGTLPGKRVRCFAHYTPEAGGSFREILLRLDTAAFDADTLKVNLVWRGMCDVSDEEAPEINALFVTMEDLAATPITVEEARARYLAAVVPVEPVEESPEADRAAANDVAPEVKADPESAALDAALAAHEKALTDRLRAAGVPEADPGKPAEPPPAPDPAAIAATLRAGGASEEDVASVLDALKPDPPEEPAAPPEDLRRRVVARLAKGEPFDNLELAGADLSDLDFGGRSLAGADLRGARLCRCSFAGSKLDGALLAAADLTEARLDGASLAGADLTGALLERASLEGAELSGCDLSRVRAAGSVLRGAKGKGATFAEGSYAGARFEGADLPAADFSRATLDGASFEGAGLPEVRLYDVKGAGVVFDDARLPGARAEGATLTRSSFKGVDAPGSVWEGATLDESTFHGAKLKGSSFARSKCRSATFSTADLTEARMRRADLSGAAFLKANLMTANLERANLTSADLRGANLHSAETWRATLDGAKLDLAIVTQSKLAKRSR